MINYDTEDILSIFKEKYRNQEFRIIKNDKQQSKTIEIQGAHFEVDKPWIIREPNYDYFNRELQWYKSQSLNVKDIPGKTPKMWEVCSSEDGYINSNYGWCIFSEDNYRQFEHCIDTLIKDPNSRQACMIYTRPSIQIEHNKDGMQDFICTYSTQCFLNPVEQHMNLDYHVFMRSNDAVFGFNNDSLWHKYVQQKMSEILCDVFDYPVWPGKMMWNAGSLHIYERHFDLLKNAKVKPIIINQ